MNPLYEKLILDWQCKKFEGEIRWVPLKEETTCCSVNSTRLVDQVVRFAKRMIVKETSPHKNPLVLTLIQSLFHEPQQR